MERVKKEEKGRRNVVDSQNFFLGILSLSPSPPFKPPSQLSPSLSAPPKCSSPLSPATAISSSWSLTSRPCRRRPCRCRRRPAIAQALHLLLPQPLPLVLAAAGRSSPCPRSLRIKSNGRIFSQEERRRRPRSGQLRRGPADARGYVYLGLTWLSAQAIGVLVYGSAVWSKP